MAQWQVNQARTHFSEVLDQAEGEGPQIITHHGKERAVVLSIEAYRALEPKPEPESKPKLDFISFLMTIPKMETEDWELERDHSSSEREIDL